MKIKTTKTCMVVAQADSIVNVTEEQGNVLVLGGFAVLADDSPKKATKAEKVEEEVEKPKKTTTTRAKAKK